MMRGPDPLVLLLMILLVAGSLVGIKGYADTIYALDRANGYLNRAEIAGFAESMLRYIREGRSLLPKEGNPVWIFPTQKTDFALIQRDLEEIEGRLELLMRLPRDSDAYQQGMDDIRGKLKTLQLQIGEAAPYLYASPLNLLLSTLWFLGLMTLLIILARRRRRTTAKVGAVAVRQA